MDKVIDWLLEGPSWVRYRCLTDLLGIPEKDSRAAEAHSGMMHDPQISQLIYDIKMWETFLLKRHNDAEHPIHKLCFLADLGFTLEDEAIKEIAALILKHQEINGPFLTLSNYPMHFGGSGKDEWLWALCDAPLLTYALVKMGLGDDVRIKRSLDFLKSLVRDNGWPCAVSPSLGSFRGPGKKSDPCPYATLIMLKALSTDVSRERDSEVQAGINTLLSLWENSQAERPYLFKMGTDFRKLKVPFIWYDILHIAEVLSHFPQTHSDKRFLSMLDILHSKADADGRFTSESIWTKWKGWEFCQKKEPSRWVTLCVLRILKRSNILNP